MTPAKDDTQDADIFTIVWSEEQQQLVLIQCPDTGPAKDREK